jgi:putative FmdB family regulatory protein
MPTYEYRCTSCGEDIEVVQSFADAPLTTCDTCGGILRKVFTPVGIVFKGSGFYKTDSRSGSGSSSKTKESTKESSGSTTSTAAKESTSSSGDSSSSSSSSGSKDAKIA